MLKGNTKPWANQDKHSDLETLDIKALDNPGLTPSQQNPSENDVQRKGLVTKINCQFNLKTFLDCFGYIVGSRGASQLGGSLLGIPLGYKAN